MRTKHPVYECVAVFAFCLFNAQSSFPTHCFAVAHRWHAPTRTFTGVVVWAPRRVLGDIAWEYRMQFSEDFEIIESGETRGYTDAVQDQDTGEWSLVIESAVNQVTSFRPPPITPADGDALGYFRVRPAPRSIFGHAFIQEHFPGTGTWPSIPCVDGSVSVSMTHTCACSVQTNMNT